MGGEEERAAFAAAFKRLRDATGATVADVAGAFGVSSALIWKWMAEEGVHRPRQGWEGVLAKLAYEGGRDRIRSGKAALALAAELDPKRYTPKPPA